MEKEFIPYEQALSLKELGFDEPCLASWNFYTRELNYNGQPSIFSSEDVIQLPTFSQAFRCFREKYELRISNYRCSIKKEGGIVIGDGFRIFKYCKDTISTIEKETYEEAELECLKKLIEIVKRNK